MVGPRRSAGAELAVASGILLFGKICELLACELAAGCPSLPREQLEQARSAAVTVVALISALQASRRIPGARSILYWI